MTTNELHLESLLDPGGLTARVRQAGMVLVMCDLAGGLRAHPAGESDWLSDLVRCSALVQDALVRAARGWDGTKEPDPFEAVPGLWFAPIPILERRVVAGYAVAVIPTHEFVEAEQLCSMCDAAKLDLELCRTQLLGLPPASASDLGRLTALLTCLEEDERRLRSEAQAVESIGKQLVESYEEINLLYSIIQSMTVVDHPERFVTIACEELLATLPYQWIGMVFANDSRLLMKLAGRFMCVGKPSQPEGIIRALAGDLIAQGGFEGPVVIEPDGDQEFARFSAFGRVSVAQPITNDRSFFGLLIAGDKIDGAGATSVDMKLLGATASHTAIFLENANLYDDLNAMFLGTLEALTASIDAKDRYTCGHSQRVAMLTQQLAEAVGLDAQTVSRAHIGGLVHDVGKIGVPERVLLKPGRLTDEEFAWIRKHPEIGYRILKDIPQLSDVLPAVLYHHERWDGGGYPSGLKGEEIPLFARLIALADSFDAMSSSRTYRSRLDRDKVIEEIRTSAGTQFDPDLVSVFLKLDFSEFDRLVNDHAETDAAQAEEAMRGDAA